MRPCWLPVILGCAWLAWPGQPAHAQSAAQWHARQMNAIRKSDALMREARRYPNLLAQYKFLHDAYVGNNHPAFRVIFGQYLSSTQTFVGDYRGAAESFSIKQSAEAGDRPSPLDDPAYTAQPALTAIPELAKGYRAVFFNEAHNIPLTRTLTVQLLARLHAEGFNYFAAETVNSRDIGLQSRGYPIDDSGFYTEEPIAAEMVRTALRLGYKVIGYDALSDVTGDARQAEQARNIHRQVFAKDPGARLVLDAGYAHIMEEGDFQGGSSMAQYLHRWYDLDILTVEQTMLYGHPEPTDDHPYYAPVMERLHPKEPLVFIGKNGKPWSLRPGYDVSVWFPPATSRRGRPTWASLGGERVPYYASGQPCNRHYPCLVEARYASEGDDAIPADRLVLDPVPPDADSGARAVTGEAPFSDLYLRPGKYRLSYTDVDGTRLYSSSITVEAGDDAKQANGPSRDPKALRDVACERAGKPEPNCKLMGPIPADRRW